MSMVPYIEMPRPIPYLQPGGAVALLSKPPDSCCQSSCSARLGLEPLLWCLQPGLMSQQVNLLV